MDIESGDSFSISREITADLIQKFAEVSGDFSPIHLDPEFAGRTRFGRPIAHGMLSGAFISALLTESMKGRTVVYLSQTLKFTAPVFIGDTITSTGTVTRIREDKKIVSLETICKNQDGQTVVSGEAAIMVLA